MHLFALLQQSPLSFTLVCLVLGLIVGSFLNVVIHRLPIMLEREWKSQCREMLGGQQSEDAVAPRETFNLVAPGSRCPHCGAAIKAWQNIPVLSYLLLRGRCANCRAPISLRYPAVELLAGLASAAVAWHFGFGWQAAGGLALTWA
ncbi:MAG: prepilin peptidase, partial [Gammaproteobacteria bacterium]